MTQLKAFAMLVVVAFTFDHLQYDGYYWHRAEMKIGSTLSWATGLHWRGFF